MRGRRRSSVGRQGDSTNQRRGFLDVLWSNFKSVYGPILALGSFLIPLGLAIAAWYFQPDVQVSLGLFVLIITLGLMLGGALLILVLTFFGAAYEIYKTDGTQLPSITRVMGTPEATEDEVLCLLEPSELFSQDFLVSFYRTTEEGFEVLIGVGHVQIVQTNGNIQAVMTHPVAAHRDFIGRLQGNDGLALNNTRVKPGAPREYMHPRGLYGGLR